MLICCLSGPWVVLSKALEEALRQTDKEISELELKEQNLGATGCFINSTWLIWSWKRCFGRGRPEGRKVSKNYAWWYWTIHVYINIYIFIFILIFIFIYMICYDLIWYFTIWYYMLFDMINDMTNDKYDVWYRSMIWYIDMICDMTCSLQYRYINIFT